ncbi:LOW QUALITY PROTEIN: conserved hypothetical protein, partial [Mycobacterium tuberculosis T46]
MTTLKELGARVAALEANQADYRAVLAAVNPPGANQREIATTVREHTGTTGPRDDQSRPARGQVRRHQCAGAVSGRGTGRDQGPSAPRPRQV